jgi:hypothetical protein
MRCRFLAPHRRIVAAFVLSAVTLAWTVACSSSPFDGASATRQATALPPRTTVVDTSRVSAELRERGGPVFVHLTGSPNRSALAALELAGLRGPGNLEHPVTFDSLKLSVAWGRVLPGAVAGIAAVPFVTCVEPSTGRYGKFLMGEIRDHC